MDRLCQDAISAFGTRNVQLVGEIGLAQFEAAERFNHMAWEMARSFTEAGLRGVILAQGQEQGSAERSRWEDRSRDQLSSSFSNTMEIFGELAQACSAAVGRYMRSMTTMDFTRDAPMLLGPWLALTDSLASLATAPLGATTTAAPSSSSRFQTPPTARTAPGGRDPRQDTPPEEPRQEVHSNAGDPMLEKTVVADARRRSSPRQQQNRTS